MIKKINLDAIADATNFSYVGLRVDDARFERGMIMPRSREWFDNNLIVEHACQAADAAQYDNDSECVTDDCDCCAAKCHCDYRVIDGTCALTSTRNLAAYSGQYVYVIGSNRRMDGSDQDEVILRDAQVICRIKR